MGRCKESKNKKKLSINTFLDYNTIFKQENEDSEHVICEICDIKLKKQAKRGKVFLEEHLRSEVHENNVVRQQKLQDNLNENDWIVFNEE